MAFLQHVQIFFLFCWLSSVLVSLTNAVDLPKNPDGKEQEGTVTFGENSLQFFSPAAQKIFDDLNLPKLFQEGEEVFETSPRYNNLRGGFGFLDKLRNSVPTTSTKVDENGDCLMTVDGSKLPPNSDVSVTIDNMNVVTITSNSNSSSDDGSSSVSGRFNMTFQLNEKCHCTKEDSKSTIDKEKKCILIKCPIKQEEEVSNSSAFPQNEEEEEVSNSSSFPQNEEEEEEEVPNSSASPQNEEEEEEAVPNSSASQLNEDVLNAWVLKQMEGKKTDDNLEAPKVEKFTVSSVPMEEF